MAKHSKALVLNADYTPIGVIGWKKAIQADFKGVVRVIDFYKDDYILCSGEMKWPVPSVVVLTKYRRPKKRNIPFSRKNVFIRDRLTCQYCNKMLHPKDLTYDHVIPRSKWNKKDGTPTKWENIVSCCYPCNRRKADKLLKDVDMNLIRKPGKPNANNFILGLAPWSKIEPEWEPYLPEFYKELKNLPEYMKRV